MLILLDNYDSFTYNIYQYLGQLGCTAQVIKNDELDVTELERLKPSKIVISPGPCTPLQAGISLKVVDHFKDKLPILGVCLGHQTIGHYFGGKVVRAPRVFHGKTSLIKTDGQGIYKGLPLELTVNRYHSLILAKETLPSCLEITAETTEGEIMGIRHRNYPIEGAQFHPESILTEHGLDMFKNFLAI